MNPSPRPRPYTQQVGWKHAEAFCVMQYRSDDGMETEVVWNSRDGVTPFVVSNRDNTKQMTHVNFAQDRYEPHRIPSVGDRVFVDYTREALLDVQHRFVEKHWEARMKNHDVFGPLGEEGAAQHLLEAAWQEGLPNLVVVTEEMRIRFVNRTVREPNISSAGLRPHVTTSVVGPRTRFA